jgi:trans-L-3-hydroxyproline dehydratase
MHTGGEPLRVLIDGMPEIEGETILEKRRFFRDKLDYIRTGTMFEPRGHADMYGAVITEPTTADGDFGTFFMHNEGYSTMCGHATLALTKLAIESGLVNYKPGQEIKIDAPPGRLLAKAKMKNGVVQSTSFKNVPSFVLIQNEVVNVPGIGIVKFDVAYGGAFYAFCDAAKLGLKLDESNYSKLIDYGRKIKEAVMKSFEINHPYEKDLSFLYGTIFVGKAENEENHSRNVCIFADGEVDRSSTGSGVSARAALHYAKDELKENKTITIESILGSTMDVCIDKLVDYGNYKAVIPEVSGTAHYTGKNQFWFDPEDPFKEGFIFR